MLISVNPCFSWRQSRQYGRKPESIEEIVPSFALGLGCSTGCGFMMMAIL